MRTDLLRSQSECRYFHASGNPLPVGVVLEAKEYPATRFERIVEQRRPRTAPERRKCFYMGEEVRDLVSLGASHFQHIYEVEPVGAHLRADASWVIDAMHEWDDAGAKEVTPLVAKMIDAHWSGRKSPRFHGWEVFSYRMRVCRELTKPEKVKGLLQTPLGDLRERIRMGSMFSSNKGPHRSRLDVAIDMGLPAQVIDRIWKRGRL